jgi:hypothetical protein
VIQTPAVEPYLAGWDFLSSFNRAEDTSDYVMGALITRRDGHKSGKPDECW